MNLIPKPKVSNNFYKMDQSLTNLMSIYIPHVFINISADLIKKTFEDLKYGKVKHIDLVDKMDKKGKIYQSAYIHFDYWFDNIACKNFQDRVKNPDKEARIVYKEPWFWICLENTSTNINTNNVVKGRGENKVKINLDDLFAAASSVKNKEIDFDYVKQLEEINYKLMYDLHKIQGDFIMT